MSSSQIAKRQENSVIQNVGCEGLYEKLCTVYGREEVGMMKSHLADDFSDAEFVQALYLAKANGVNPLKKQCFFYIATSRRDGKRTVVFMVGIDGFRARAKDAKIPLLEAHAVCENDDFEWDQIKGVPSIHRCKATGRGKVVAGWGRAQAPWMVQPFSMFKTASEWLEGKKSVFHREMETHMMEVTIERNLYKIVAPDVLPGATTPEEWGGRIIDGKLSMDPSQAAGPPTEKDEAISITKDERDLLIKDIRLFMDRLGIEREDARWDKLEKTMDRKLINGKKWGSIPDWDITLIHSKLQEESQKKDGPKEAEVITPEEVPQEVSTQKKDEEPTGDQVKDLCETCHGEIPAVWGATLTRFKATMRECQPCYQSQHKEPVQVQKKDESDSPEA